MRWETGCFFGNFLASMAGVFFFKFLTFTEAPFSRSKRTIASLPDSTATWMG